MKCHLNTQHPEEYQKISEYLSDADAVMAEKSRANKWLRNGKYTPYARWDIWGVRLWENTATDYGTRSTTTHRENPNQRQNNHQTIQYVNPAQTGL